MIESCKLIIQAIFDILHFLIGNEISMLVFYFSAGVALFPSVIQVSESHVGPTMENDVSTISLALF